MSSGRVVAQIANRIEKAFESRHGQCGNKWRHENILTAMQHAKEVAAKKQKPYMFYECQHCGYIHVGGMEGTGNFMYGPWCVNGIELQIKDFA